LERTSKKGIVVSSDAGTRLEIARAWLEDYPSDTEAVVLAHSAEAANDFHLRAASERGAWFGVRRYTLNGLAARLAQSTLAESGTASASSLSFIAVVARAIHSLQSESKLKYFAPVATRPGFPVAVARTLEELRMNEVDVAAIARLARGGGDLAAIAQAVEHELEDSKLADRAAIFRAAIKQVSERQVSGDGCRVPGTVDCLGLPLLLLDVAVQSRLESRLIGTIAAEASEVLVTVPRGDERTISALEKLLHSDRNEKRSVQEARSTKRPEVTRSGLSTKSVSDSSPGTLFDLFTDSLSDSANSLSGTTNSLFNSTNSLSDPTNSLSDSPNSLSFAKEHLFEDSAPPLTKLDSSFVLRNWPGEPRECAEIVRSIQAEAARGVPFDQMAVFLNSPGEYRSHLEEAFNRAEIPAYFAQGSTAPDPAGRAMLALLSCAAEGLSARRFAEYLSLAQVPDQDAAKDSEALWMGPRDELVSSPTLAEEESEDRETRESVDASLLADEPENSAVIEGNLRAPWRWEQLLVDSAVIGSKDRWVRRLDGLANELRLKLVEAEEEESPYAGYVERQLKDLDHLRAFALPVVELLATLPDQATWGEWLSRLRQLAEHTLRDPRGILSTLAELAPMGPVGPVDLYEVRNVLEPRLRELGVAPPRRRFGSVFVGPVGYARGLAFDVVFIPGLAEKLFPRKLVEDPILPDRQRQEATGTVLFTRRDRLELERLALRMTIGAARERAYLSYPRLDVQQSRPRVPSFYALEALRAAEGTLPGFEQLRSRAESATRARLGWPAPENPAAAIDESEYDLALLATLVDAKPKSATGSAHYLLSANSHLARALRARFRRWSRKWTMNDGLVMEDTAADELGREAMIRHQLSARAFSSTALQRYASCPYQFFLNAVVRLRPREEASAIEVMDPLTRGALFHETQFAVLTKLKADGLLPLGPTTLTQACTLVDGSLDEVAHLYEDKLAPAIPRVWRDSIEAIRADLREWLRRSSEAQDGWVPDKFELAFAMDHIGSQDRDPDSVSEPVEIAGGLQLRGSIDLVERHASGKLRVTDHKTGKARAAKDLVVGGGKSLQPLLYALAAEKLLEREVEAGRLYYCTAAGGYEERVVRLNDENRALVTLVIEKIDEALAAAFLPAAPEKDACTWCDFLAVCGSREEIRTRRKPGKPLAHVRGIRELP